MCGIAGIVAPAGFAPPVLERMTDAIAHRGPDASGYLVWGGGERPAVTQSAGEHIAYDRDQKIEQIRGGR